ncbi:TetR/AcrR family transcriptional regulator [Nocardia sp. N2S4-5]|uniref:TetR/AcrR family transcriptional regulator n=1 Tax=Nocardia sp. N2S4-5 TaxID=3351565 RepID=UPI0037CCEEC3
MATKQGARARRHYGGRTAEERAGQRRERLLQAALELFGTQGYSATSIEQLCSAASISTRSFYEEMSSREQLLIALADDLIGRAVAAGLAEIDAAAELPLAERIARGVRAYLQITCRTPGSARVCYIEVVGVSDAVERWRAEWRKRIGALLQGEAERAVSRGQARPRDYRLFAISVMGAVNSLAQELARHDPESPLTLDDICAEIGTLIGAGVA